jgi:hypothetical protein
MYTLLVLSAVLSSFPAGSTPVPPRDAAVAVLFMSSRLEVSPAATPAASPGRALHLLNQEDTQQDSSAGGEGRILLEAAIGVGLSFGGVVLSDAVLGPGSSGLARRLVPLSALWLGSSMGVTLVGNALGARGSFGYALLGSALGLMVPFTIGALLFEATGCASGSLERCEGAVPIALGISLLTLPTLGAIIAYESSTPSMLPPSRNRRRAQPPAPRVVPLVSLARQGLGATVGIAGTL